MTAASEAVSPQIVWIDISNSQQRLPLMVVSRNGSRAACICDSSHEDVQSGPIKMGMVNHLTLTVGFSALSKTGKKTTLSRSA